MKHKPFEEWIFSDDEITPADRKALYDHLQNCDSCYLLDRNWRRAETLIQHTAVAAPASGFIARWQARLEADRRRSTEKQSIAMLLVTSMSAWMFLLLFGVQLFNRIPQIFMPAAGALAQVGQVLGMVELFTTGIVQQAGAFRPVLPVLATMAFFAVLGAAAILWLKMFRTLARVQGVQRWA